MKMDNVCVLTGGGGNGIGGWKQLRILGKAKNHFWSGRTISNLDNAIEKLKSLGIEAEAFPADASNEEEECLARKWFLMLKN